MDAFNSSSFFSFCLSCTFNFSLAASIPSFKGSENVGGLTGVFDRPDLAASNLSFTGLAAALDGAVPDGDHFGLVVGGEGVGETGFKVSRNDWLLGNSCFGGVTTRLSNAASLASILDSAFLALGVIPATSLRPPIPPNADVKLELLVIVGLFSLDHLLVGTAGAIGRIELIRFGGLEGGSLAFCRALSSHEDFVGDHLLRARESVLADVGSRGGGVKDRSIGDGSTGGISTESSV